MKVKPTWMERREKTIGGPRLDVAARFEQRTKKVGKCLIWTGHKSPDGYGVIGIGRGAQFRVHRIAWEMGHGKIPQGLLVCHSCDNPVCVNISHLFLGTPMDNVQDMLSKGRNVNPKGEHHPLAKLSDQQVMEIQKLRRSGALLSEIANRFGISFQWVSHLCRKGRCA